MSSPQCFVSQSSPGFAVPMGTQLVVPSLSMTAQVAPCAEHAFGFAAKSWHDWTGVHTGTVNVAAPVSDCGWQNEWLAQ